MNKEFFLVIPQSGKPNVIERDEKWIDKVRALPPIVSIRRIEAAPVAAATAAPAGGVIIG